MTDCFTCAAPENYAAVALKLQQTAIDAENCIFALEQRLRGAVNPLTLIAPITLGSFPSDAESIFGMGTPTFHNSTYNNFNTAMPRGIYQVGMYFTITAVGAVNDNTYRFARISTRSVYSAASVPNSQSVFQTTFEANTGNGMDMMLHTTVTSDGTDKIQFFAQHGNTSSNCTTTNGVGWVSRLSDLDAPRVVR